MVAIDYPVAPVVLLGLVSNTCIPDHQRLDDDNDENEDPPGHHNSNERISLDVSVETEARVVDGIELVVDTVIGIRHVAERDIVEHEKLWIAG